MEFHGVKIDFMGLAAAISAVVALVTALKGNAQKAKAEADKKVEAGKESDAAKEDGAGQK